MYYDDGDPLRFAKFYATEKHGNQKYGPLHYTHHLRDVEMVLRRFGEEGLEMLSACWLHDVVEDTEVKLKEIYETFGPRVGDLVGAVTNVIGPDGKPNKSLTYPKIRNTPGAVRLKLADRIANVSRGGHLVKKYKSEYEDFRRALYTPGVEEEMWAELDARLK
jgi:(p)ppGpp synthase/HD superfamily hydrolase